MKRTILITCALAAMSCSNDKAAKKRGSFPVPSVSEIVEEAAPSSLKDGAALTANQQAALLASVGTAAGIEQYVKTNVFQKAAEGPLYYRYYVDVLDSAMAETEFRINGTEFAEGETPCFNAEPIEVTQQIGVGGQTVDWTSKFNCWEEQSVPTADRGGSQIMAFGKDDSHFYLNYLTRSSTEYTGNGDGEILVLAKASIDGNVADVWNIGQSFQMTPGSNTGSMNGGFSRIIANKETGEFSFLTAMEPMGHPLCTLFIRSNGTKIYIEARADAGGAGCADVTDMVAGSGKCFDAADMSESTGCDAISTYPTEFLLTAPVNDSNVDDVKASSTSLVSFDFEAAGIGRFGPAAN
jgi:hypothetical protein